MCFCRWHVTFQQNPVAPYSTLTMEVADPSETFVTTWNYEVPLLLAPRKGHIQANYPVCKVGTDSELQSDCNGLDVWLRLIV